MRGLFTSQTLTIQPGQAVSGIANRAQTLHITRGRVWITVEGVAHDYILHAGDTFTTIPGRLTVVEADQEASIDSPRPAARPALQSICLWLAAVAEHPSRRGTVQISLKRHRLCSDAC